MTEEEAQEALLRYDWPSVVPYVFDLIGSDVARGEEWMSRLGEAALPRATGSDPYAAHVMGTVHTWRFLWEFGAPEEELERALGWLMKAARHDQADAMIEQVAHWYGVARSRGLRFSAVEAFFKEPEIELRWHNMGGAPQ